MKNKLSIIIPSFNEAESLRLLLGELAMLYPESSIYIVDDSSGEEKNKIVNIVRKYKNIELKARAYKLGRGSAVIDGFKQALKKKKVNLFLEMDSDLAHDPKEIKRFLNKEKEQNYDLVIGSRYLKGGRIVNIEMSRTIMSRLINIFLKFWLGIKVSDFTSGFRLYSRRAVKALLSEKIESTGFIALSETLFKINAKGLSIGEVPITWNYRKYGKSNVNLNELLYSLYFVLKMKLRHEVPILHKNRMFVAVLIFLMAFSIRLSTLNQMGRTWDEPEYVEQGYQMVELLKKGDLGNNFFYTTYDHPPLVKYLYGISAHFDIENIDKDGKPVFKYDYTYSRIFSSIASSLSAVVVFLIAGSFASLFVAFSAAVIFLLLPFFIGLSQLVTTESFLVLLFTLSIYLFIKLLKNFSNKWAILVGISTGLALLAKQSNALLFPLFGIFYYIYYSFNKNKIAVLNKKIVILFLLIFISSIITFVVLWPMPYTHLDYIMEINKKIWFVNTAPPEVFWGKLILSPVIYFPTMFFITTPLLIIVLSLFGLRYIDKSRSWISISLIIWFLFPFVQSFYPWRMHGVRYIIEIYVPLSIIAALGLETLSIFINKKLKLKNVNFARLCLFLVLVLYLISILFYNSPYFLNYYNELVGGQKGVYEKKYFHLGWWGDGMRQAGIYLEKNANKNSTIGLAVNPPKSFPTSKRLKLELYSEHKQYDYVVVNYYHVLREGFDDSEIKKNYELDYQVISAGAPIVSIYKR